MSHEEQTDLRIRRTHTFLQEAMIELIKEKGFHAITVGEIAERAIINRATFYRHYQDRYDLVAGEKEQRRPGSLCSKNIPCSCCNPLSSSTEQVCCE